MKKEVYEKKATFGLSLLVFVLATAIILVGILVLGLDAHIPSSLRRPVVLSMACASTSPIRIWSTP